jgi:hypothetical protein
VVRGALGILLRGKTDGAVHSVTDELHKLRKLAGFFIAPALEAEVIRLAGE